MSLINTAKEISKFALIVFLAIFAAVSLSCIDNSSNLSVSAQSNRSSNSAQNVSELLSGIENPCDFMSERGLFQQPGSRKLYELVKAGYPKEISLDEGVKVFNNFVQCGGPGKTQPPLSVDEIVAAIRDYDCRKQPFNQKQVCAEFQKIAETNILPKGALLDYVTGVGGHWVERGNDKYDVITWEIYLYLHLDKYRNDLKGVPQFSKLIRLTYISSNKKAN